MYFLGIDMGTSYFKTGIFDRNGSLVGLGRVSLPKLIESERIEITVPDFWNTLKTSIEQALLQSGIAASEILAASYSSQANTFLLCDKEHRPLTNFIVWNDTRAKVEDHLLLLSERSDWNETTGIGTPLTNQMCISKISWFQKHKPDIWQKTRYIKTIADYLTYELTDNYVVDTSTASLTGFLNSKEGTWWNEALKAVDIDEGYLLSPKRPGSRAGNITPGGASKTGLYTNIVFALGALDHHAAAIGAGLQHSDDVSESTGTVIAVVKKCNEYRVQNECYISQGLEEDSFFQMAFDENGAASLQWYHDNFAPQFSLNELLMKAALIPSGSDGLIASPCVFKYRHLNGFKNIQQNHHHGHFVRAIMESTARSLAGIIQKLNAENKTLNITSTGGGAKSILWSQIKAQIINANLYRQKCTEAACMGAAMIAAINTKYCQNINEIQNLWGKEKVLVGH